MHKIRMPQAYLLIAIAFFVQAAVSLFLGPGAVRPNAMILVTTFLALFTDRAAGMEAGAVAGMLMDIFSLRLFGLNTLLYAASGYIVGRYNSKFYRNSVITYFIITFGASLFVLLPYFLFISLRDMPKPIMSAPVLFSALLNALLAVFVYAFLSGVLNLGEREI